MSGGLCGRSRSSTPIRRSNGGYPFRQVRAETPAQLRRIVEWARANPDVTGFPYARVRERYGNAPESCINGHSYDGGSAVRARNDWTECVCGGHLAYICHRDDFDDFRIVSLIHDDCTTTAFAAFSAAKARC